MLRSRSSGVIARTRVIVVMLLVVVLALLTASPAQAATERARLTWDTSADMDLHVWDEAGNEASYDNPNGIPNATLSEDQTTGYGPEFYVDSDEAAKRTFTYSVCYFDGRGATNATLALTDPDGTKRTLKTSLSAWGEGKILSMSPYNGSGYTPPSGYDDGDCTYTHEISSGQDGDFSVIDGTEVPDGKYQFIASVRYKDGEGAYDQQFCGGTLIDKDSILTAAHCVRDIQASNLSVTVGTAVLDSAFDSRGQVRDVSRIDKHPSYKYPAKAYDVAVLKLKSPVTGITPVRLPSTTQNGFEKPGSSLTVAGWGSTAQYWEYYPYRMREAQVPVVSDKQADVDYLSYVPKLMVAAGEMTDGGKKTCQGDSGGPLFAKKTTSTGAVVYYQVGITSFASGECGGDFPAVFTEVNNSNIRNFIISKKSL